MLTRNGTKPSTHQQKNPCRNAEYESVKKIKAHRDISIHMEREPGKDKILA
jgi:hypothetical protein